MPFGDRNEAGVEPQRVGDDERGHAEQRVGEDVKRDEQAVVPDHRAAPAPASCRTSASISSPKRSRPNRSAWRRMAPASKRRVDGRGDGVGERLGDRLVDEEAGFARRRPSRARRRGRARRPAGRTPALRAARCRSLLRPGSSTTAARRYSVADLVVRQRGRETRRRPSARALERGALGAVADDLQRHAAPARQASIARSMRL